MRNIVSILEEADAGALVLLDELGAGTDPQEGAALGLAIIEDLLEAEALVAVSTHLTPLKYFAIRHPAVKTASMEFDVETLSPTFRVIEGVPGKSNAFVIARGLGLSEDLVTRARSFLTKGEIRAEDIIEELERERQTLLKHRSKAEQELAEASRLKHTYTEKVAAFEEAKEETLSTRIRELEAFLRRSQQQVERLLREIKASPTVGEAKRAYRELADLRGELRREEERATRVDEGGTLSPDEIQVGQRVHVHSLGTDGKIVSISPRGKVTIDLQGIRVSTEAADLSLSLRPRVSPSFRVSRVQHSAFRVSRVSLQLNVRGMTISEALRELETYLDQLLLADIRSASVLHGKGTGALRDAINAYLSSCSFVSSCSLAPPREGGEGVTVFELAEE
jgi:DNA mismatch repair protein MutS2